MAEPICPMCHHQNLTNERDRHLQMCEPCSRRLGVVPLSRPRDLAPCRSCKGLRFVRVQPRELGSEMVAPMSVTFGYRAPAGGGTFPLDPSLGFGTLELYICKGCGLADWYCLDPDRIPIGAEYMTEEVVVASPDPYR